jgi:signal transduction histidine kinase
MISKTFHKIKNKGKNKKNEITNFDENKIFSLYHLAEFGKISFGIFHDLANILTSLILNLEQINVKNIEQKNNLKQALKIGEKLNKFLNIIKKQQAGKKENINFNINDAIEECLEILNYQLNKQYIKCIFKKNKKIIINGPCLELERIIFNIISNSIDSYDNFKKEKKKITIKTFADDNKNNNIHIEITDNGKGIKQENLKKIFEPFFSTKKQKGLGIGLFASKNILKKNFKGNIKVTSKPDKGTKISLTIPKNIYQKMKLTKI